ncbi:MAG: primosomal protein N' [Lachnospiraceae bacterium]|nr:primosomal protein N' [Lachnospiraceae bacterium]
MSYAQVIVDISHENVDRPFSYRIPEHLREQIVLGSKVEIPFGKSNRLITGYVVDFSERTDYDESRIKDISSVCEKSITAEERLISLAAFIKEKYGSTMITALKTVLPVKKVTKALEKKSVIAVWEARELSEAAREAERKSQRAKARLLDALCESPRIDYSLVTGKLNVSAQTILSLQKQGIIEIEVERSYRNPVSFREEQAPKLILSDKQQYIVDEIEKDYAGDRPGTYLIHGITGSGKTEVYMELIAKRIEQGQQAIFLIPEISLTYQNVIRFYRRFGDKVSIMHSKLSQGERHDQMERAKRGETSIMIGPRSALFTPFSNLGIIIIDEEHEGTYKSETMPKYHAREVACEMAKRAGAAVVLGSATPSLESYSKAQKGEYRLFTLKERLTGGTLANVNIVDLRQELKEGNKSIFSHRLKELMEDRLEKGEQIMLFLNRRGYSGFVSCRSCGEVIKCPHCDVSLSEHRGNKMVCHYCGYEQTAVHKCPACGSNKIAGFKAGTQQIEEAIHRQFPQACVLRMDADTTKNKDDYETILSKFSNREADILLGTQMIVKGHDFPGVTLMGILAADLSLSDHDFRSSERTFQLLTQAAGRAGRGQLPGEVIIQTYQPEHYAIVHAAAQDYESFYEEELLYREFLMYPPAANMMAVQLTGPDEKGLEQLAKRLADEITKMEFETLPMQIGPAKAALSKKSDLYRQVIYYKHKDYEELVKVKDKMEECVRLWEVKKENVQFDFNPINTF